MLENLSRSLQSIFNLYKEKRNSYFGFSFAFGMLTLFASLILSLLISYAAKAIFEWEGNNEVIYEDALIMTTFPKLTSYFYILSFGMYAIYLKKILHIKSQFPTLSEMNDAINEKPTLKELFASITPRMQTIIIGVIFVIGIIYTLLFKEFYNAKIQDWGMINQNSLGESPIKENFFIWVNAVVELFKQYLPYFGTLYIFLCDYDSTFSITDFSKYKHSIVTFILLAFCIVSISANVKSYLDIYIISIINIPFEMPFVRGIFMTFMNVFFGAFFFVGFAASILYPVVNQQR